MWRIHHALADGTTVMRIGRTALWNEPEAKSAPSRTVTPVTPPTAPGIEDAQGLHMLVRETPHLLLRSPFDGRIGSMRSVAFATGDLEGLHRVARRSAARPSTTPS